MIYVILIIQVFLIIYLYKKLSDKIETESVKLHNIILLPIKKQLDMQDVVTKAMLREMDISIIDTRSSTEVNND